MRRGKERERKLREKEEKKKKRNGREKGIRRGRDMNMSNIQQSALQVQR